MDHRAPRLVIIARIITVIFSAVVIANLKWNLIGNAGWNVEESAILGAAITVAAIAWWASKEKEIPQFDTKLTSEQQIQSFEDMPTKVRSSSTTSMDQYGFETVGSSPQTSAIINSILGQSETAEQQNIEHAIGVLGIVDSAQPIVLAPVQIVVEAPTQQMNQQPVEATMELAQVIENQPSRVNVERIALPHEDPEQILTPIAPGLEVDRVFVSEGIAHVPLPDLDELFSTLPPLDETFEESSDLEQNPTSDLENLLPMLPELPEIVSESHQELPPAVTVIATPSPELPDLDDLF
ncbi:MAG: hypothetical protein QMC52_04435 [Candidatus Poseidoniaceae archaeon]